MRIARGSKKVKKVGPEYYPESEFMQQESRCSLNIVRQLLIRLRYVIVFPDKEIVVNSR